MTTGVREILVWDCHRCQQTNLELAPKSVHDPWEGNNMKSTHRGPRGPLLAVLSSAIAVALYAVPAPSFAQAAEPAPATEEAEAEALAAAEAQAETTTLDTVNVTGFRGSLERALDIKRDEVGVVDAIVAEDIADFPDLNLAESLQRIPGVSISRDA